MKHELIQAEAARAKQEAVEEQNRREEELRDKVRMRE